MEARRSRPAPVAIAQLTDLHVVADDPARIDAELYVDNNARLEAAVDGVVSELLPVDVVVGTGDLTNDGRPEEYEALRLRIEPIVDRWLPLPGNHDDPDAVRALFPDAPWADTEHASWAVEIGPARIVGLDSTRPAGRSSPPAIHHGGGFDTDRAEWLDHVLGRPHDGATVLAMHHPPFASGIRFMDQYGFEGIELLAEVLRGREVDQIVCGHLHRPMSSAFAGIPAQVGPSTVQHVGPDLRPDGDVTVSLDPPGYQVLLVREDGFVPGGAEVVVHRRYLEGLPPISPEWADEFD